MKLTMMNGQFLTYLFLGCFLGLNNAALGQEGAQRKYTLAEKSIQDAK